MVFQYLCTSSGYASIIQYSLAVVPNDLFGFLETPDPLLELKKQTYLTHLINLIFDFMRVVAKHDFEVMTHFTRPLKKNGALLLLMFSKTPVKHD